MGREGRVKREKEADIGNEGKRERENESTEKTASVVRWIKR